MSVKLLDGITAFFTTKFEGFFNFLRLIKTGVEKLVNNRVAIVSTIVATVKSIYDFSVAQVNKALDSFNGITNELTQMDSMSGIGEFLAFGNTIFPLSETMTVAILLFELWLVCTVVKLILRLIPCI